MDKISGNLLVNNDEVNSMNLLDPLSLRIKKVQASLSVDSSLETFGICPHCEQKMERATCARKQVFVCDKDRVVLPIIEEENNG